MGSQPSPAALLSSWDASLGIALDRQQPQPQPDPSSILDRFDEVFEEAPARGRHNIEEAFRLRYDVYCIDRGYEDATTCTAGMERDRYDVYAHHTLLRDRASKRALGTSRLIKPTPGPDWISQLPLSEYAAAETIEDLKRLPNGATAEVSRFAISRSARDHLRQPVEGPVSKTGTHPMAAAWRPKLLPYMSLGLVRGMLRLSLEQGVTHWCLATEPSVLRRFRACGLHLIESGPLVEHRGLRKICHVEIRAFLDRAKAERPDVWNVITCGGRLMPDSHARSAAA